MKELLKNNEFLNFIDEINHNENIIACMLFGSYAKENQKPNSDIDICIFRKKDSAPKDFEKIINKAQENYDIVFFDTLSDIIKFRVISEGKTLVIKDNITFLRIKHKFLHIYRDNFVVY